MSEKKPSDVRISAIAPFGLRMLPDLRARVEEAAEAAGRSMNAEIVARLEASFSPVGSALPAGLFSPEATKLADKIVERVVERVERIKLDFEEEVRALQEENRALRAVTNSPSPE